MQGRLTPLQGRGIQFFPFDNWRNEFNDAREIKLDQIEFIFDLSVYRNNPLWSKKGRKEILSSIKKTGIQVNNICADYFMRRPFFRVNRKIYNSNIQILKKLIEYSAEIGANLIGIPLLDNSSIKNKEEEIKFIKSLFLCLPFAEKYGIKVALEADLKPKRLLKLIETINHPLVGINYDTGNSSSLGYDHKMEIETYGRYIINVHIKDRIFKGTTVELGKGDAKFDIFFKALKNTNYSGPFILQAAREADGEEKKTINKYNKFLSKWL